MFYQGTPSPIHSGHRELELVGMHQFIMVNLNFKCVMFSLKNGNKKKNYKSNAQLNFYHKVTPKAV